MARSRILKSMLVGGVCALALAGAAVAQTRDYNVPAGDLKTALDIYARQSGVQLIYRTDDVRGKRTAGARGPLSPDAALRDLLAGSGLSVRRDPSGAVAIFRTPTAPREPDAAEVTPPTATSVGEVVVTGTNIRGAAPRSTPLQSYNRAQIEQTGAQSLSQFMATIPQNSQNGSTEAIGIVAGQPKDSNTQQNVSGGTGVNLRGIGSSATLVLVNGQRLAPSSTIGDFVDISAIPLSAVERVDVLPDGASAIYGGDAVAGVVNIILKDHFDGFETGLSYGRAADGDGRQFQVSQLVGTDWQTGSAFLNYEYSDRHPLLSKGKDWIDPSVAPFDLLPATTSHSVFGRINQDLTDRLHGYASGIYYTRDYLARSEVGFSFREHRTFETWGAMGGLALTISPSWSAQLDTNYSKAAAYQFDGFVIPGVGSFTSNFGARSQIGSVELKSSGTIMRLPGGPLRTAFGVSYRHEEQLATTVRDNRDVLRVDRNGKRDVKAAFGELLIPIFGEDNGRPLLRSLEINASARIDDYSDFGTSTNPKVGVAWSPVENLTFRASYSKSFNPPDLGSVGANDYRALILPNLVSSDPNAIVVRVTGTGSHLRPELGESFTTGLDYSRTVGAADVKLRLNYYDVTYTDRVAAVPVPGGINNAFNVFVSNPALLPAGTVISNPTGSLVAEVFANARNGRGLTDFTRGRYLTHGIDYIGILQTTNLASTNARGLDFDASASWPLGEGRLEVGISGVYAFDLKNKASSTSPEIQQIDTIFNPADLNARARIVVSGKAWQVATFFNYTDSYANDTLTPPGHVKAFETVDLSGEYRIDHGALEGLTVGVSAINLFNTRPPAVDSTALSDTFATFYYDPANASPTGRFVSVQLRKRF